MEKLKAIAILLLLVAIVILTFGFPYWTADETIGTVTGKERVTTGSGENLSSKYLVFTQGETFENTDCLARGKWNSSDLQGRIQEGQRYRFVVYGWRVPFLSYYRNIVQATPID